MIMTKWDRIGSFIRSDPGQNTYRCSTLNTREKCCMVATTIIYSHGVMIATYNRACAGCCSRGRGAQDWLVLRNQGKTRNVMAQ